ncbi:beta-lactamase [Hymenobacter sp. DG25A]|nr:beta-lactamase [Hymenobacter sp. DG25A]
MLAVQFVFGQSTAPISGSKANKQLDVVVQRAGEAFIKDPTAVGLSIGIIHGKQTYFYNFGTVEKGVSKVPTQNTVYEIGSISKTFTSLLLARAVAEKRVSLQDDVRKYLKGEYPNLAFAGKPIKLVHLANTTSALPDNLPDRTSMLQQVNPDSIPSLILKVSSTYTKDNFYHDLHSVKLDTVPGLISRHSNAGAQLLAYILESIYQAPYEKLVEKYIEKPLHMQSTASVKAGSSLLAVGHNEKGNRMPYHFIDQVEPSGGLRYSAVDMLKYLAYQLAETDKAVVLSHQPMWGTPEEEAISLNWSVRKTTDNKRQLLHTGGTFGFASYCSFYPELGFGIVVLANESDRGTQGRLQALADQIIEDMHGVPPALQAFRSYLATNDYSHAVDVYQAVKKAHPELHLTEEFVNEWGYTLVREGKIKQAIELFKLNVSLHPNSWNSYDSLGEAYEMAGDSTLSITNYQQSLILNPKNTGAVEHLKKPRAATGK